MLTPGAAAPPLVPGHNMYPATTTAAMGRHTAERSPVTSAEKHRALTFCMSYAEGTGNVSRLT